MQKLNLDRKNLREFGLTLGAFFLVISGVCLFKQKSAYLTYSLIASCVSSIMGLVLPSFLKPVYIVWMRFAFILGWINTRIILVILFYLVFTPLGLLMRLFRIDLLERENKLDSYWKKKEKIKLNPLDYERRF